MLVACLLSGIRFNPHTHAGCDNRIINYNNKLSVSIHTPTQGVTEIKRSRSSFYYVSIHTPTQGVTNAIIIKTGIEYVSIHTPSLGVYV